MNNLQEKFSLFADTTKKLSEDRNRNVYYPIFLDLVNLIIHSVDSSVRFQTLKYLTFKYFPNSMTDIEYLLNCTVRNQRKES